MSKKYTKLSPYEIDRVWRYLSSFFEESNVREVSAVTEDIAEAFFRLGPLSKGFFPQTMRLLKSEQTYLQLSKFLGGGLLDTFRILDARFLLSIPRSTSCAYQGFLLCLFGTK